MTEGDPESREALLVGSCARSALNDHTTTLTSSSWRLRAEKPPWRPPSCFVPDFDGAFLSSDSKDALWDRFYTERRNDRGGPSRVVCRNARFAGAVMSSAFWRGTSPAGPDGFRWFVCLIKRTSFALRLCCRPHEPILVRSHHNVVTPDSVIA